ncbi:MAG: EAL domain-containing protein [Thiobacillus sp.]|nr:EAL domain-containing protein [Thiobacillus sp.]
MRSTIEIAHNLGLRVVAEGVETSKILTQLCLPGCDQAQGYFFSQPVAADNFYAWALAKSWKAQLKQACNV